MKAVSGLLGTHRGEHLADPGDFIRVDCVSHTGIDPLLDIAAGGIQDLCGLMHEAHRNVRVDIAAPQEDWRTL